MGYNRDRRRWENEKYYHPILTQKPPKSQGNSVFEQHKHFRQNLTQMYKFSRDHSLNFYQKVAHGETTRY